MTVVIHGRSRALIDAMPARSRDLHELAREISCAAETLSSTSTFGIDCQRKKTTGAFFGTSSGVAETALGLNLPNTDGLL